ncbi:50S ribosomal protein L22 [Candidatus Micrarchaeota archaeon]|nr:50S ribosomal protein L22 [Candidatus Micrarchaeota archaeon]
MKSYSFDLKNEENYAKARLEGVDASFKDLCEVCGRVRGLRTETAVSLLEKFSTGELPVLYKSHNKRLGHRREIGGKKGRYPEKSAKIVLKLLKSAIANAEVKGLLGPFIIEHASANKKHTYPRLASKGRRARSDYETSRVEIIIKELESKSKKQAEKPKETKKAEAKKEEKKPETKTKEIKPAAKEAENEKKKTETKTPEEKETKKEIKKEEPEAKKAEEKKSAEVKKN